MIDLSPVLLSALPAVVAPAALADGAAAPSGSFGQTLGAFLDAHDAALDQTAAAPPEAARQALAEDGKDLPAPAGVKDDSADPVPLLAWFEAMPLPAIATSAPVDDVSAPAVADAARATPPAATTLPPVTAAPPPDGIAVSPAVPLPDDPQTRDLQALQSDTVERQPPERPNARTARSIDPTGKVPNFAALAPVTVPAVAAANTEALLADALARTPLAVPRSTVDRPAANPATAPITDVVPTPPIAVSAVPQPAGQLFAAALAVAGSWRDRDPQRATREQADATLSFSTQAPLDLRERAVVHAAADTGKLALDLTGDTGLQRMIDRIETLRDDSDARDTRVRLVPDALGSVAVAVRQEGDRIHVRFTAEHEATRALIAEAQPRLNELAAARGVRIGETSVSTEGGGNTPQPRPTPSFIRAPARIRAEAEPTTDQRLA